MTLITADQLLAHAVGDYVLQSDWMASEKTKRDFPAGVHALIYTCCFLPLLVRCAHPGEAAIIVFASHGLIDRFRLARFVVFAKNFLAPRSSWPTWSDCAATGYPSARPPWLAVWLLIIADNVMHVAINGAALGWS
jgi:hypothetical protein